MTPNETVLTPQEADEAYVIQLTLDQVDQYIDGDEMGDIVDDFTDAMVEVRRLTARTGRRHFLMLEVIP